MTYWNLNNLPMSPFLNKSARMGGLIFPICHIWCHKRPKIQLGENHCWCYPNWKLLNIWNMSNTKTYCASNGTACLHGPKPMNKILAWVDYGKISFPVGKLRVRISWLEVRRRKMIPESDPNSSPDTSGGAVGSRSNLIAVKKLVVVGSYPKWGGADP